MSRLDDIETAFGDATGKSSDVIRSLALTGIGVTWLLAGSMAARNSGLQGALQALTGTKLLFWAFILQVGAILLDLLQYIVTASVYGSYRWAISTGLLGKPDCPAWQDWLAWQLLSFWRAVDWLAWIAKGKGEDFDGRPVFEIVNYLKSQRDTPPASSDPADNWMLSALDSWLPARLNILPTLCFFGKTLALSTSYVLVGVVFWGRS